MRGEDRGSGGLFSYVDLGARVGADHAYDTAPVVAALRALNATPHVAQNLSVRRSRVDRRTVRHPGYLASQRARKRIEEGFAWTKTIAPSSQAELPRHRPGRLGVQPRGSGRPTT